jgi:hypothetical protein
MMTRDTQSDCVLDINSAMARPNMKIITMRMACEWLLVTGGRKIPNMPANTTNTERTIANWEPADSPFKCAEEAMSCIARPACAYTVSPTRGSLHSVDIGAHQHCKEFLCALRRRLNLNLNATIHVRIDKGTVRLRTKSGMLTVIQCCRRGWFGVTISKCAHPSVSVVSE